MVFLNLSIWIIWEEAANCSYQTTLREKPKWRRKSTRLCRSIKTYISCFSGVFCWWLKTLWQLIFIISETEIFSKWADVWLLEGWVHRTDSPTTVIKAWEYALHSLDSSFIMHVRAKHVYNEYMCKPRRFYASLSPPKKEATALFSGAAACLGFSALKRWSPRCITHESGRPKCAV